MKNKFFSFIFSLCLIIPCLFVFTACGKDEEPPTPPAHSHTFSTTWEHDEQNHWNKATCEHTTEVKNKEAHSFGNPVITEATQTSHGSSVVTCTVCSFEKSEVIHNWNEGVVTTPETCDTDGVKTYSCTHCSQTKTEPILKHHSFYSVLTYDDDTHWYASSCGHDVKKDEHSHNINNKQCVDCGYKVPSKGMQFQIDEETGVAYLKKVEATADADLVTPIKYNGYPVVGIWSGAFSDAQQLTSITLQEGIQYIGTGIFYNLPNLKTVSLPSTLLKVYDISFVSCDSVESVYYRGTISQFAGVEDLGYMVSNNNSYSFYINGVETSQFENIELDNSVTTVQSRAFYNFANLKTLKMGNSVKIFGSSVFQNRLESLYFNGTISDWANINFLAATLNSIDNFYINNELQTSEDVVIDSSICKNIGAYAFANAHWVKNVTISDGCLSVGNYAFAGCVNNESINLGNTLVKLGQYAFSGNILVTEIIIPDSVQSLDTYCFARATNLEKIKVGNGVIYIPWEFISYCEKEVEIILSESVKKFNMSWYTNCPNIKCNIGENNIKYLGTETNPYYCAVGLVNSYEHDGKDLVLHEDCKVISYNAFYSARCNKLVLPDGIEYVNDGGASIWQLDLEKKYTIENNVRYVGSETNPYLYLDSIVDKTVTEITINENCKIIGFLALAECKNLVGITIPDSVEIIEERAFANCYALTEVVLGNGLKRIYTSAFLNCKLLESVEFPDSLTFIDNAIFSGCKALTEVVLGDNVEHIGNGLFVGNTALETFTFNTTKNWTIYHDGQFKQISASELNNNETIIDYFKNDYLAATWKVNKD